MSMFTTELTKQLMVYKIILRQHLSHKDANAKIRMLRLTRACIKYANDLLLYEVAMGVSKDIDYCLKSQSSIFNNNHPCYRFYKNLMSFLAAYHVEGNKVIHVRQRSASELVDIIQLVTSGNGNLEVIQAKARYIFLYGSSDQKMMLKTLNYLGRDLT